MIGYKDCWYGKECEGRFKGIETFFIHEITEETKGGLLECPHVYLTSHAVFRLTFADEKDLAWTWDDLLDLINKKDLIVSIEIPAKDHIIRHIPDQIKIKTHMMYSIEGNSEIRHLKPSDSIKIVYDPYTLYCNTVENMQKVTPEDYSSDLIY